MFSEEIILGIFSTKQTGNRKLELSKFPQGSQGLSLVLPDRVGKTTYIFLFFGKSRMSAFNKLKPFLGFSVLVLNHRRA